MQESSGAIIRMLAEAGADLNSPSIDGVTPLVTAVMAENTLGVMVLLGRLHDINSILVMWVSCLHSFYQQLREP